MRTPFGFVFTLVGLACLFPSAGCSRASAGATAPPPPRGAPDAAAQDAGGCPAGLASLPDAEGCSAVLPAAPCAAGTSPSLGETSCVPVGMTECPSGLTRHASGWGCDAIVPPKACAGPTRDAIGEASCVPVGDCSGTFPPANATLFVSAAYTAAEIDATHFAAVDAAVVAATAGSVIAVDSGTYNGTMEPLVGLTIVGRCAARVIFQATDSTSSAIAVHGVAGVSVSNVTLLGYYGAVAVVGGSLALDSVVVDGSVYAGIAVEDPGASATLTDVVVRNTTTGPMETQAYGLFVGNGAKVSVANSAFAGNEYINVAVAGQPAAGASLQLASSVVRDGATLGTAGGFGWGVFASGKVTLDVSDSAIVDNVGVGINLFGTAGAPVTGSAVRTIVRGTKYDAVNKAGIGVEASSSSLILGRTTIADSDQTDLYVEEATSAVDDTTLLGAASTAATVLGPLGVDVYEGKATLNDVAIVDTRAGMEIQNKASVTLESSLVSGTRTSPSGYYEDGAYVGVGVFVEDNAKLDLTDSAVVGAHTAGVLAAGEVAARGLVVLGTLAGGDKIGGRGVAAEEGAAVSLTGSAIVGNAEAGALAMLQSASLTLADSVIDQTSLDDSGMFGIGVLFGGTATGSITGTTIRRSQGVALVVSAASATVAGSVISQNNVAVDVDDGTSLTQGTGQGAPNTLTISADTVFLGNTTRIGSGPIPVPTVLAAH